MRIREWERRKEGIRAREGGGGTKGEKERGKAGEGGREGGWEGSWDQE